MNAAHAVNILQPNGGVTPPIPHCSVITIPSCIGSIPALTATGKKMGTSTKHATVGSTNMQLIKKNNDTTSRTLIADGFTPRTKGVSSCGKRTKVISHEKACPTAIRTNRADVTMAVDNATL